MALLPAYSDVQTFNLLFYMFFYASGDGKRTGNF
ncbi:MAG: hypothetical protein JWP12_2104 [Bacteroidetes bacterium]|nr:hypothetical protein [Bacteroidota bacterium]